MFRRTMVAAAVAASLLGAGTAALAQLTITLAPPAPQHEVAPAPRSGYVWVPGHYEWRADQHVWVRGHWLAERTGYDFRAHRWVQRGNGDWVLVGGNWERRGPGGDRDGDGIANRYDRDKDGDGIPNARDPNPNRRNVARNLYGPRGDLDGDGVQNRYDRDRDGDGVRNARDRWPSDRRRS